MKAYWQNLTERERLIVTIGAAIIGLGLFFLAVVNPLNSWRDNAERRSAAAERNFGMVRQAAMRGGSAQVSANADTQTPVRNVLSETASSLGFPLSSYNPLPDGNVTASVNSVGADQLFNWIGELERRYGITVVSADIAREADNPDLVRVQLTLGRSSQG